MPIEASKPADSVTPGERSLAVLVHAVPAILDSFTLGFAGCIAPLFIWLATRKRRPFVAEHARQSLNFRVTLLVALLCLLSDALVLGVRLLPDLPMFGEKVLPLLAIGVLVLWTGELLLSLVASIRAAAGRSFRYPIAVPLFR